MTLPTHQENGPKDRQATPGAAGELEATSRPLEKVKMKVKAKAEDDQVHR